MAPLDPRALRNAFGTFMTGVTVVTANDKNGKPIGFTANSFSSVSLDPPLVLICLANSSSNYETLVHADGFAVNILSETQTDISNTFARPSEDRFAQIDWHKGPQGSPIIEGTCAWFDCTMHKTVDAGDHVILIGAVQSFDSSISPGLGYARGAYVTPSTTAAALTQGTKLIVSALIERNGQVYLREDSERGLILPEIEVSDEGASTAIKMIISKTGLNAKPGFIYSVYENMERKSQHITFLCQAADGGAEDGRFHSLENPKFDGVTDPTTLSILQRFALETTQGNYGIYFGNQTSGEVRPTA